MKIWTIEKKWERGFVGVRNRGLAGVLCAAVMMLSSTTIFAEDAVPTPTPNPELTALKDENAILEEKKKNLALKKDLATADVPAIPTASTAPTITAGGKAEATILVNKAVTVAAADIAGQMYQHWDRLNYWQSPARTRILVGDTNTFAMWQNASNTKNSVATLTSRVQGLRAQIALLSQEAGPIVERPQTEKISESNFWDTIDKVSFLPGAVGAVQGVTALATAVGNLKNLFASQVTTTDAALTGNSDLFYTALSRELSTARNGHVFQVTLASDMVPLVGSQTASSRFLEEDIHNLLVASETATKELDALVGAKGTIPVELAAIEQKLTQLDTESKADDSAVDGLEDDIAKAELAKAEAKATNDTQEFKKASMLLSVLNGQLSRRVMKRAGKAPSRTVRRGQLEARRDVLESATKKRLSTLSARSTVIANEINTLIGPSATPKINLADYQKGQQFNALLGPDGYLLVATPVTSAGNIKTKSGLLSGNSIQFNAGAVAQYRLYSAGTGQPLYGDTIVYLPYVKDGKFPVLFPTPK